MGKVSMFRGMVAVLLAVTASFAQAMGQSMSEVVAWGGDDWNSTNVPSGLIDVVAVSTGYRHHLALTLDGRVMAWGTNSCGQTNVPIDLPPVIQVAAGLCHSLALTVDGRVIGWGLNDYGQTRAPDYLTNAVAIQAGYYHSLALTSQGRVVAWGAGKPGSVGAFNYGQSTVPDGLGNVVAVAAGASHSLALTADGRVVIWGGVLPQETEVPRGLGNVIVITSGSEHCLALGTDGKVVAWGRPWEGQIDVPPRLGDVIALTGGSGFSLALTAGGRVLGWGLGGAGVVGYPHFGQTTIPDGLSNVVAVTACYWHSLALRGFPSRPPMPAWTGSQIAVGIDGMPFHRRVLAKNGADSFGASGLPPGLLLDPTSGLITGRPETVGKYAVTLAATNSVGATSWTETLVIAPRAAPAVASSGTNYAGLGSGYRLAVDAYNLPEWYGATGLPAGAHIDPQTGVISGRPTELGDFKVNLVVSNRYGTGTGAITLRVSPVVVWSPDWMGGSEIREGLSNIVSIGGVQGAVNAQGIVFAVPGSPAHAGWPEALYGLPGQSKGVTNLLAVATGDYQVVGLRSDGRVVQWDYGTPPRFRADFSPDLRNVVAIASAGDWSAALTAAGQTFLWLRDTRPWPIAANLPIQAIALSPLRCLTLVGDHQYGYVGSWNLDYSDEQMFQQTMPFRWNNNIVAMASGDKHDVALTSDGRVLTSGTYFDDHDHWLPMEVPAGLSNVVAVAAGDAHCLALKADGRVVSWGVYDQSFVPEWLDNVVAIAASGRRSVALMRQPNVPAPRLGLQKSGTNLVLQGQGTAGLAGQLLRASQVSGPWVPEAPVLFTNQSQVLLRPQPSGPAQFYRYLPR